ncbi:MAG: hypothetical protein ACKVOE_05825 [Rickettsiales bacterium]
MQPHFLFLSLNSYFAAVEQQLKPDLGGERRRPQRQVSGPARRNVAEGGERFLRLAC